MKRLLSLSDNALFLANTRERLRPAFFLSALIITGLIVTLIIINNYVNPTYDYSNYQHKLADRRVIPTAQKIFWDLAVGQGILILLIGTISANRMASRERTTGTIEFHRSSPTPKTDQIIGLLFGAPCLEWILFGLTAFISVSFAVMGHLHPLLITKFYVSIIICAIFYHLIAILVGILSYNIKNPVTSRAGNWTFWIFLWFALSSIGIVSMSLISFFYHLTWIPSFNEIHDAIFTLQTQWPVRTPQIVQTLNSIFCVTLPSLIAQFIFQIPLMIFLWIGIHRKISRPEHPALSQPQALLLSLFVLIAYIGSGYSAVTSYSSPYPYGYSNPLETIVSFFVSLCLGLSTLGILNLTPNKELFVKGLYRIKKMGENGIVHDDSHQSNANWLAALSAVIAVSLFILGFILPSTPGQKIAGLALLLSYIIFFGSALEFFKLTYPRQKQSIFWTVLAILWIFLPILGAIIEKIIRSKYLLAYFTVASPMNGVVILVRTFLGPSTTSYRYHYNNSGLDTNNFELILSLIINISLAVVMQLLALKQRQRLTEKVLSGS